MKNNHKCTVIKRAEKLLEEQKKSNRRSGTANTPLEKYQTPFSLGNLKKSSKTTSVKHTVGVTK